MRIIGRRLESALAESAKSRFWRRKRNLLSPGIHEWTVEVSPPDLERAAMRLPGPLSRRLATLRRAKPFTLQAKAGVISFTFDDVPRSALTIGGDILERHQVAGTYYVAGGLTGTEQHGFRFHRASDVASAARGKHEIGSHGYAHLPYTALSPVQIDEDLKLNHHFLSGFLGDIPPVSFSYPFGALTFKTKRLLAARFSTARGTSPGINSGSCDLADLRANAICACKATEHGIRALIKKAVARRGWLIFYTHDVSDIPTAWGTTPALLEFAIREAVASGCRVLPIRDALVHMTDVNNRDQTHLHGSTRSCSPC
jgi:peptidoglycan/xylan/chitin deacetylase (PgdA/CDA1 family)